MAKRRAIPSCHPSIFGLNMLKAVCGKTIWLSQLSTTAARVSVKQTRCSYVLQSIAFASFSKHAQSESAQLSLFFCFASQRSCSPLIPLVFLPQRCISSDQNTNSSELRDVHCCAKKVQLLPLFVCLMVLILHARSKHERREMELCVVVMVTNLYNAHSPTKLCRVCSFLSLFNSSSQDSVSGWCWHEHANDILYFLHSLTTWNHQQVFIPRHVWTFSKTCPAWRFSPKCGRLVKAGPPWGQFSHLW